jgi:quinol monooxygenase YgiN
MSFIQIIRFQTKRPAELAALDAEWRTQGDGKRYTSAVVTSDRDRPDTYVTIVEFPSYEAAMANNEDPATQQYAARMAELCTGPAEFWNLDVQDRI